MLYKLTLFQTNHNVSTTASVAIDEKELSGRIRWKVSMGLKFADTLEMVLLGYIYN